MFLVLLTTLGHGGVHEPGSGSGFVPGAVCADIPDTMPAQDMLRGKHLVLNEMWWEPFAKLDSTKSHGWSGMNIDYIERYAAMLNFTYEIRDSMSPEARTLILVNSQRLTFRSLVPPCDSGLHR